MQNDVKMGLKWEPQSINKSKKLEKMMPKFGQKNIDHFNNGPKWVVVAPYSPILQEDDATA